MRGELVPPTHTQQHTTHTNAHTLHTNAHTLHTIAHTTQVRRIIAKRLLESKQTSPSLYVSADAPLDGVQALRKQLAAQVCVRVRF